MSSDRLDEFRRFEDHMMREERRMALFLKSYMAGTWGDPDYLLAKRFREAATTIGPPPDSLASMFNLDAKKEKENLEIIEFNDEEEKSGFRYLFGVVTLRWWAVTEAVLDDILLCWLTDRGNWNQDVLKQLKGNLVAFALADPDDQSRFLAEHLRSKQGSGLKKGIGRFEDSFDAVGLGGVVNDDVKNTMFEFSQVRNVLAHRSGLADRQFVTQVQWFPVEIGEELQIDFHRVGSYNFAASAYVSAIVARVARRLGESYLRDCFDLEARYLTALRNQLTKLARRS